MKNFKILTSLLLIINTYSSFSVLLDNFSDTNSNLTSGTDFVDKGITRHLTNIEVDFDDDTIYSQF